MLAHSLAESAIHRDALSLLVVTAVIALNQDWVPFLTSTAFVAIHPGLRVRVVILTSWARQQIEAEAPAAGIALCCPPFGRSDPLWYTAPS
jgi:hypothetical protein